MKALLSFFHRLIQPSEKEGDAGYVMPADSEICWFGRSARCVSDRDENGFIRGVWPADSFEDLPAPNAFSPDETACLASGVTADRLRRQQAAREVA